MLSGHTGQVYSVVFSSDGTSLVSGSGDRTVKLWNIQTGGVVKTFFGHTDIVVSVSISADCNIIASGSGNELIHLWNIQTGECYCTIQHGPLFHVVFSPNSSQYLISISDISVFQWDASGFQIRPSFQGVDVAFSSDGTQFVSCFKKTITVCDSSSGEILTKFQSDGNAHQCSFSPDKRLIAVAVGKTAYCWDITTSEPQLVETLIGHASRIVSLVFSSPTTLVSASQDNLIKFWPIRAQSTAPAIIDLQSIDIPLAPIESVALQSKEGAVITSDSDGVIKVWDISTGSCKTSFQTPVKAPHRRDTQLINSRLIFIWYGDRKIYVQNAESEELLLEVDIPWDSIHDLKISGDGSRVFGLYTPFIWAWSLQTGEVVGKMEIEYQGPTPSLVVDGSKVWVCCHHSGYQGWDFGTPGSAPVGFSSMPLFPGPYRLWDPSQARIKNPATGEIVFQLPRIPANLGCVQCDGSYLVAGYQSGEVLILDLTNVK